MRETSTINTLTITPQARRRFILGQQGLFPGRRWQGKEGVGEALRTGSVVQIDPLNVLARSHDIALYGRVAGYRPEMLDEALHRDRIGFDWGGTVIVFPMEELPYLRVIMRRKREEPRWKAFAAENAETIDAVRAKIREQGPVTSRSIASAPSRKGTYRSGKISGLALYYLWLSGELMTHSRQGFERVYDRLENVAPLQYQHSASEAETEDYYALRIFDNVGMTGERGWRATFAGTVERRVSPEEAAGRIDALVRAGAITPVKVKADGKEETISYVKTEHLPLLEALAAGETPDEWQPLDPKAPPEMTFLAPLEIASARGRAMALFGFEYIWEVYKPVEKRRWGYYTLPVLYGDQLVARFDARHERAARTLLVKNFWLEDWVRPDDAFLAALQRGFQRFQAFTGAENAAAEAPVAPEIAALLNGQSARD